MGMNFYLDILLIVTFQGVLVFGQDPVTTVKRVVDENVTLECTPLTAGQEFQSVSWTKDGVILATMNVEGVVKVFIMQDQANITSPTELEINFLKMADTASYMCTTNYKTDTANYGETKASYDLVVQDVPSAPGMPKIDKIESRRVTVTWTPPLETNNSPVNEYILQVRAPEDNQKDIDVDVAVSGTIPDGGGGASVAYVLEGLSPNTLYQITVQAVNSVGIGQSSKPSIEFITGSEAPGGAPLEVRVAQEGSQFLVLEWKKPAEDTLNGDLQGYIIEYGISGESGRNLSIDKAEQTTANITDLKPYTLYNIAIQAKNVAGTGPKAELVAMTAQGLPSAPIILKSSDRRPTSFKVHWTQPHELNGQLEMYMLRWNVVEKPPLSRSIKGHLNAQMDAKITGLIPFTQYSVAVAAVTKGGQGNWSLSLTVFTDYAAPGLPHNLNVTILGQTSVRLTWEVPDPSYLGIAYYNIEGWNNLKETIKEKVNGKLTEYILSGLTRNARYFIHVRAAVQSMDNENHFYVGDFCSMVNFTMGDLNAVTSEDSEDSKAGHIALIVILVLLLVLVAVLAIGFKIQRCRRCYFDTYSYFAVSSSATQAQQPILTVEEPSEEKHYPDIDVADFLLHVERMHTDSDIAFSQEFDEINRTSHSGKYSHENSELPDNRNKNRYINIIAYDHSRVILKSESGRLRQSDYINANYVDGYQKPKAYIATQGPLPQTFPDFWRMVWEQNTNVIIMITNLMEKGRRKCDQYWPSDGQENYGSMQVKLITTVPRAHYTVRIFTLRNIKVKKRHSMKGSAERTIYHYHYTEWPDHGVPDYSLPVLSFVQKSAAQSGQDNGPIVVHCSAGVGRTGTYILIDSMIAQIEDKRSINIPGFTQHIRRQRNFLVQTEDQYIFIHEVLKEYLLADGVTEVREDRMVEHLQKLEQPAKSLILTSLTSNSVLEKQYQLLTEYTPSEMDQSAALKPMNQAKNRVGSILPVNMKRVLLPARPGVEGSDYINATFLQGYKKSAEFIVTQHPTEDTMEDFWRMVWDKNSPVIVVLSPIDGMEYKEFWPPKGSSIEVDSGNFRLVMKDEPSSEDLEQKGINVFEFILDSIQYDYTLLTRVIFVREWPASFLELPSVFDPIILAHNFINSLECGPIIVMDRYGGVESGTFCALWTLRDQVLSERSCDFYEVCKLYHYKRPGIIGTQADYLFIHRAMAALCARLMEEHNSNGSSPRHHHNHHGYHFPSLHLNSLSGNNTAPASATRHNNGSLPQSTTTSINNGRSHSTSTTPTSNNMIPMVATVGSGSHTLPRVSTSSAARASTTSAGSGDAGAGGDSGANTTTAAAAAVPDTESEDNKETNI